ncbi:hypothetical protein QRO11_12145 [Paracidovorax citrulli]|uniref:hypothetical protein n=1 Tax=Paracidovorax citrulli TaxID=80869 RepID=UPI0005FB1B05|nr:hypothetical protein [Paracidovorax citrulli]UMT88357.1 hypothetical protein FRC90_09935 [Paracidovorax citrulli]WIY32735.1 hypothetical protein QRO11_12145 [Paracidovorax citrulli]SDJ32002.1 hypothetical protein SAMN04489709_10394 [Paracidovorax citrulli]
MHLARLSNDEVLRIARAEINDLTSTALEVELLKRLEALLDDTDEPAAIYDAAADHDLNAESIAQLGAALIDGAENTAALLHVLADAGYESPEALKTGLATAAKFAALAIDAGDVLSRLSSLTETVTA